MVNINANRITNAIKSKKKCLLIQIFYVSYDKINKTPIQSITYHVDEKKASNCVCCNKNLRASQITATENWFRFEFLCVCEKKSNNEKWRTIAIEY